MSRRVTKIAILLALYFVTARLGLALGAVNGVAASVWAPAGISLAAILLCGRELWPGTAAGAFLANATVGVPIVSAAMIGVGNTLEAVLAATVLGYFGFKPELSRIRDAVGLLLAAALGPSVSAGFGVTSAWMGGVIPGSDYGRAILTWWTGDMVGILLMTPWLLALSTKRVRHRHPAEIAATLGAVAVLCASIFLHTGDWSIAYLVYPALTYAVIRLECVWSTSALLVTAAIATTGTALGNGPFATGDLSSRLFFLQLFMAVTAATFLVFSAAVAEQRLTELARRRDQERYWAAQMDSVVRLTGGVAHHYNNLLAIMLGYTELARTSFSHDSEGARDAMQRVASAGNRAAELTRQLVALARRGPRTLVPVSLNELVHERLDAMTHRAGPRITVRISFDSGLAPTYAEPDEVRRALDELVANACDAMPNGGVLTVTTATRIVDDSYMERHPTARSGEHVVLTVADTGVGISEEASEHLFEPFFTTKPIGQGTGLGLAMCYSVVARTGGHITVDSSPGSGTSFHLHFPVRKRA